MYDRSRTLMLTEDGSHTISVPELNLTFHSRHGAIQESRHVFIEAGLRYAKSAFSNQPVNILEVGFGTGLNAFLSAIEAHHESLHIHYTAIEAHPLDMLMTASLNYPDKLGFEELFNIIQLSPWNTSSSVHERFSLNKLVADVTGYQSRERYHLVYFDAFAPDAQPELWTEQVFRQIGNMMHTGGALVTYCSKGDVRRAMQAAGWTVTKLPGPKGKREMVRALWRPAQ